MGRREWNGRLVEKIAFRRSGVRKGCFGEGGAVSDRRSRNEIAVQMAKSQVAQTLQQDAQNGRELVTSVTRLVNMLVYYREIWTYPIKSVYSGMSSTPSANSEKLVTKGHPTMKTAVRALVLGMLITGFAADHMLASKSVAATPNVTMVASNSAAPVPTCRPGSSCGFNK
jgi:hypothetical protein